mmetsp:Transcript_18880/g.34175  ORF Transcript_18880/g.34175 Transcript_18880/m.34175 type:complete len:310 (-) Transcript_18880:520-1449(-)
MEDRQRAAHLVCRRSKEGMSLPEIADLLEIEVDEVIELIALKTGLTHENVRIVLRLHRKGFSFKQISEDYLVSAEQLAEFLSNKSTSSTPAYRAHSFDIGSSASREPSSSSTFSFGNSKKSEFTWSLGTTESHAKTSSSFTNADKGIGNPKFIYSTKFRTNNLYRLNLSTHALTKHKLAGYLFKDGLAWCEGPEGVIYISGGSDSSYLPPYPNLDCIDTMRDFAVTPKPDMLHARYSHRIAYHIGFIYAIGGWNESEMSECERFNLSENRWESVESLPQRCYSFSMIECDNSFLVLGESNEGVPLLHNL